MIIKNTLKNIFISIEKGLNTASEYDKKYILPELDAQQLAQRFGNAVEAASRGELKKLGLKCKPGNPKDKNEDDVLIIGHRNFDYEMKLTLRKYGKRGKPTKASWWTDRNGCDSRKRNFICIEAEYKNDKFKFHNIYISYQKFSYNDIKSHYIREEFIKENSINILND